MKNFTQKKILATISLIIIATFSVIASMAFAINPNSGTLQGSTITLEITSPADGTNVPVPTGAINVQGTVTITNFSIPSRPDLDDQRPSINGLSLNHTTSTGTLTTIDLIGGGYFDETTNNFAVPLNVDCDSNLIEVTLKVWGFWPWLQDDHRLNLTSSITVIGDCEVAEPAIDIEKYTNGEDADSPTGPIIPVGDTVEWTYIVTNTGNVPLSNAVVTDDILGTICTIASLAVGDSASCTASGTAMAGQYTNIGNVTGEYDGVTVYDEDPSNYYGDASPGTGTPGYWKNHPEAWPVDEIEIGGITYTKDAAIAIMNQPVEGDKTFTIFNSLISAKLNILIGNEYSCIAETVVQADQWMADNGPPGSGVLASSDEWETAEPLHETLDMYNNGELCAPERD
jgi:uncharacterized repeat protein (TIGR01451 family)